MASIAEVGDGIFRVNLERPGARITYSFFVIRDEACALVETSFHREFAQTVEAVKRLIDLSKLKYIVVPHFEADECGALNDFLALAPNAQPVSSPISARSSILDFAIRDPIPVTEEMALDLGQKRLGFMLTPYVHQWDAILAYEETTRTLFSSDVFIQPGAGPATIDTDRTDEMVEAYKYSGILPSRPHLDAALDKIEAFDPQVLACHHGSVITGQVGAYIKALRDNDVTGIVVPNP
jgi:flavorubredoxin